MYAVCMMKQLNIMEHYEITTMICSKTVRGFANDRFKFSTRILFDKGLSYHISYKISL